MTRRDLAIVHCAAVLDSFETPPCIHPFQQRDLSFTEDLP
jgi:hypothetical protein